MIRNRQRVCYVSGVRTCAAFITNNDDHRLWTPGCSRSKSSSPFNYFYRAFWKLLPSLSDAVNENRCTQRTDYGYFKLAVHNTESYEGYEKKCAEFSNRKNRKWTKVWCIWSKNSWRWFCILQLYLNNRCRYQPPGCQQQDAWGFRLWWDFSCTV